MAYFRDNIERMAGYTPGFQPKGTDVVKLNTNENPYPASPTVLKAIGAITAEQLRRYPDPTGESFRKTAADVLGVRPENILCTNGGDDLLTICVRACCDAGRPLAYAQPTYSLYPVLAAIQDCPVIEIDRNTPDMLGQLAKADAALTIVCNPNAPTCDRLPVDALANLASKLSGVLLVDEAYVDFAEEDALWLTLHFDNVLLLRSMSKGYSLAGMRFGFGIGVVELIDGLMKVQDSYPVDAIALQAATAAIRDQAYFKENIAKIKAERDRLTEALRALGLGVPDSQTNFVLAQYPNAKAVFKALTEAAIFVRYFKLPHLEDKLRITVGTPEQNDKLLAALKTILAV
ncbi:MAG: histidinol-phosphate transaminase [Phycisphaerae bacterium]|nr:histidinol-phosphate transaminase [Phycisphaerae bacterium]